MNSINKKIRIFSLVMVLASMTSAGIFMQSCSSELDELSDVSLSDSEFALFEKEFINSLLPNKDIVKLTGFKTYNISEEEKDGFKKLVSEYGGEMKKMNTVVADDYSCSGFIFHFTQLLWNMKEKPIRLMKKGLFTSPI